MPLLRHLHAGTKFSLTAWYISNEHMTDQLLSLNSGYERIASYPLGNLVMAVKEIFSFKSWSNLFLFQAIFFFFTVFEVFFLFPWQIWNWIQRPCLAFFYLKMTWMGQGQKLVLHVLLSQTVKGVLAVHDVWKHQFDNSRPWPPQKKDLCDILFDQIFCQMLSITLMYF